MILLIKIHTYTICCQEKGCEQDDPDVAKLAELTNFRANQLSKIKELEAIVDFQLKVTTKITTTRLHFPCGERRQSAVLGIGEVLWSPDPLEGVPEAACELSMEEIVNIETGRTTVGVLGIFVREWGTEGQGDGEFLRPTVVTVHKGEVFVGDTGNHRFQVFGLDGVYRRQWGEEGDGPGQFMRPSGVAVHGEEVFVCDTENDRVQVFGLDGTYRRQWGTSGDLQGQFNSPGAAAVHRKELFVCDQFNSRVQVFGLDGTFLREWETHNWAWDIWVTGDQIPIGIAVRGDEVFVSVECHELTDGEHRVHVFGLDGLFFRQFDVINTEGAEVYCPRSLAVHEDEIIVCESDNPLNVFGLDETYRRQWGTIGEGEGQFEYPADVAVNDDEVFVVDRGNHRVQVFV